MPNLLSDPAKPAAPAERTFSEADMRAAQAETAARFLAEQNRELQMRARFGPGMNGPPRPAGPDPLAVFAEKGLTLQPEENARLLDAGLRGRAQQEAGRAFAAARQEFDQKLEATKNEMAINNLRAANPDIEQDQEGFAAALAKAQFRAQGRGIDLDGPALVRDAVAIYRKEKAPGSDAPTLEGVSRADGGGVPLAAPAKPAGKSLYEKLYGKAADDTLHEEELPEEEMLFAYSDMKNGYLEKMGVPVEFSEIRQVQGETSERKERMARRGAA